MLNNNLKMKLDSLKFEFTYEGLHNIDGWNRHEFDCYIYNDDENFTFNTMYYKGEGHTNIEVTKNDFMYAILLDATSYLYCETLEYFMLEYGYEDFEIAENIYNQCKDTYESLNKYFTYDEIQKLYNYYNELDNEGSL